MDATERHVCDYLRHTCSDEPVYEPDGNLPPDFLISGQVAVEARRLNQHDEEADYPRGLEETAIPFQSTFKNTLKELGSPMGRGSWFVSCSLRRPLPKRREVQVSVRSALMEFASLPHPAATRIELGSITLRLSRAGKEHPFMFVPGASVDHDGGGFVVAELARNLEICIAEKTRKISRVRYRYPTWWLVFVDEIAYGQLDASDIAELRALRPKSADVWNRIVLLNPLNTRRGFDL